MISDRLWQDSGVMQKNEPDLSVDREIHKLDKTWAYVRVPMYQDG